MLLAFAAAAAIAGQATDGRGDAAAMPRPALVLFWADWCAPCRAEMLALPEIERAVAPLPVVVVPLSNWRALPAAVDRRKIRVPDGGGWDYLAALRIPPALPAAAIVDARGVRCAMHSGGLDALRAAALVTACASIRK
ncbi:hypothetical protein SPAN111604_03520 [Sphingomonas antarctica]